MGGYPVSASDEVSCLDGMVWPVLVIEMSRMARRTLVLQ
jgi:hypothetical protein